MPMNLMRLIIEPQSQQNRAKSIPGEPFACSRCYSECCYSDEDRSLHSGYSHARPGGPQPLQRGVSRVSSALPADARGKARIGGDELRCAGGTHRTFEALGAGCAQPPGIAPPGAPPQGEADLSAGLHGADALAAVVP